MDEQEIGKPSTGGERKDDVEIPGPNKPLESHPNDQDLVNWFTYHRPTPEDAEKYVEIREAALTFARIVMMACPGGADRTTAIRKIREAVMTANAAIACAK